MPRHNVLEPYKHVFDMDHEAFNRGDYIPLDTNPEAKAETNVPQTPEHRYLFNCFVFQYNLLQISSIVLEMVGLICPHQSLCFRHLPTSCFSWMKLFAWRS